MIVVWSRPARDSFYSHIEYLLTLSPVGARNVNTAVIEAIGKLEHSPFVGRPGRWENTRELIISKYPYIVTYRLKVDVIEILYIHHTRQEWPEAGEITSTPPPEAP